MQSGIPFPATRTSTPPSSISASKSSNSDGPKPPPPSVNAIHESIQAGGASVAKLVSENSVIVFGRRECYMCHVVKLLLLGLGANPPVVEVDEDQEAEVIGDLSAMSGGSSGNGQEAEGMQFPAVFVGGKWFGGLERVMATHISGELVPTLKQAGALWL